MGIYLVVVTFPCDVCLVGVKLPSPGDTDTAAFDPPRRLRRLVGSFTRSTTLKGAMSSNLLLSCRHVQLPVVGGNDLNSHWQSICAKAGSNGQSWTAQH